MATAVVSTMTKPLKHILPVPLNGIQKYHSSSTAHSIWRPTKIRDPPQREIFSFDSMGDALMAFAAGEFLVVMDDENRENEGDLIIAAAHCTTEKMAWMIKHTRYVVIPTWDRNQSIKHPSAPSLP
jgi:hypothetical protein